MVDTSAPRMRSGGRAARRALRGTRDTHMLPGLTRAIPECEVMDADQVERIDRASMDILENIGVQFRDPVAIAVQGKAAPATGITQAAWPVPSSLKPALLAELVKSGTIRSVSPTV